jgi:hypothetical protein
VTPVVCARHGIVSADTGMNAAHGPCGPQKQSYPCPECGVASPRWDRKTCPECRRPAMEVDPHGGMICWD